MFERVFRLLAHQLELTISESRCPSDVPENIRWVVFLAGRARIQEKKLHRWNTPQPRQAVLVCSCLSVCGSVRTFPTAVAGLSSLLGDGCPTGSNIGV